MATIIVKVGIRQYTLPASDASDVRITLGAYADEYGGFGGANRLLEILEAEGEAGL